jgi:peptidoglycan/xylan/chitin deacetylase (PgdA/CDA1 family)
MSSTALSNMRWVGRCIKNRFLQGATILIYHRVADLPSDWQLMSVTPQHFGEQLEVLRKNYYPMSLRRLQDALQQRKIPKGAVAITFDDGYADNLHNAKPLLEKYDIPATFYVTYGCLDQKREFWWDDLDRMLLQPSSLPPSLTLTVEGKEMSWRVAEELQAPHGAGKGHHTIQTSMEGSNFTRKELYRALHTILRPMREEARNPLLAQVAQWSGSDGKSRQTHSSLTTAELQALGKGGLVEIGAHTVTHPVLSSLTLSEQRAEILGGKRGLEEKLNRLVLSFAYPYGGQTDYSNQTPDVVRDLGFVNACSNFPGIVRKGVDSFQLPRVSTRNWNGDEFSQRMRTWFPV